MIDEQADVELASGPVARRAGWSSPSRIAALAIATASITSDLPRSRAERRGPAISFRATRTTRSPRTSRKRSSAPDTWRQSSIVHTRSAPTPRAHRSRSSNERRLALAVRSPSARPVAASTAPTVCDCLWVSAPITIIRTVPSLGSLKTDRRRTHLSRGDATLLSGHAGDPRTAAGDTTSAGQTGPVDRKSIGQPVADPRTYRPRRTPPPDPDDSLTEKVKLPGRWFLSGGGLGL